jgi:UDP-glucuronate 4-epimerase
MKIIVTGCAGFIGFHLCERLLQAGYSVHGIDSLNSYYDVGIKTGRLDFLKTYSTGFSFSQFDLSDYNKTLYDITVNNTEDNPIIIHLAAQPGVAHSAKHPESYTQNNLVAFANILEVCRKLHGKLYYASSSSVYGFSADSTDELQQSRADYPLSYYGATKRANEIMAYSYFAQFGMESIGMRFFSVYGPWGRPDMVLYKILAAMDKGEKFTIFGNGEQERDFTYVDDVVEAILQLMNVNTTACAVVNIGARQPHSINEMVRLCEKISKTSVKIEYKSKINNDVFMSKANINFLQGLTGWSPKVTFISGVIRCVDWYNAYYNSASWPTN